MPRVKTFLKVNTLFKNQYFKLLFLLFAKKFVFNTTKILNIEDTYITKSASDGVANSPDKVKEKFKDNLSVLIIKTKIFQENQFSFTKVFQSDIQIKIKRLNVKNTTIC